jgi:hypothetical protein
MFSRIFRRLSEIKPPLLGRWCIIDKSKNNWKIDMANVDHCGTCSYEAPKNIPKINDLENTSEPTLIKGATLPDYPIPSHIQMRGRIPKSDFEILKEPQIPLKSKINDLEHP